MFECLILGDSTGLGTARAVNARYAAQCDVQAAERATAAQMLGWAVPAKAYGTTILAVGSNDMADTKVFDQLSRLRARLATRRVIWLLPYARPQAYLVSQVAFAFGDETLDLKRFPTRDNIHPRSYGDVASSLLK